MKTVAQYIEDYFVIAHWFGADAQYDLSVSSDTHTRNTADYALRGRVLFAPAIPRHEQDEDARRRYSQGSDCIELVYRIEWGGCNHRGDALTQPRIAIDIYDRRERWDAQRWYSQVGDWGTDVPTTQVVHEATLDNTHAALDAMGAFER